MKIRTKWNKKWLICDVMEFDERGDLGHCNPHTRQILIKENHPDRVWTFIHELLHAMSFDYDIDLTETQVQRLEQAIRKTSALSGPAVRLLIEKYANL